jgi:hypothetical protein
MGPRYSSAETQVCHRSFIIAPMIVLLLDLQLLVQLWSITTKVVSLNPVHDEVYSIQHYVIKFVSDVRQDGRFLRVVRFPPPIKLTAAI